MKSIAPTNRLGASYVISRNALPCAPQGGLCALLDNHKFCEEPAGVRDGDLFLPAISIQNQDAHATDQMPEDCQKYRGRFKEGWEVLRDLGVSP